MMPHDAYTSARILIINNIYFGGIYFQREEAKENIQK